MNLGKLKIIVHYVLKYWKRAVTNYEIMSIVMKALCGWLATRNTTRKNYRFIQKLSHYFTLSSNKMFITKYDIDRNTIVYRFN
jgi:hypothetical protein